MRHLRHRRLAVPCESRALRQRLPALGLCLALSAALCGCGLFSAPIRYRGQNVTPDQLRELVPGTTTEADVRALLGEPTSQSLFDADRWAYIGQQTQERIGRYPGVVQQDVVVLTFNSQGLLQSVQHLDKKNAVQVSMAAGATPSPGGSASFIQQLIGNVGRYSPTPVTGGGNQGGLNGGTPNQ
ncbi:MAG TPA: outer membrane protein assembly factor BamE [Acetobacteraceae bacterium]|nr:outer membrane protein assembly factor BamE [Acetobacteraceae bacterium]